MRLRAWIFGKPNHPMPLRDITTLNPPHPLCHTCLNPPITLSSVMSFMDNPNDTNPDTVKFSNTQTLHGILTRIELFTSYIYIIEWAKKRGHRLMTIMLSILNRFNKFFQWKITV